MTDKNPSTKNLPQLDPRYVNTVIIGGFSSRCGNCNGNAFPDERAHITQVYDMKEFLFTNTLTGAEEIVEGKPGVAGCGTTWLYMDSDYIGEEIREQCERKWPQYEWIGR